MRKHIRNRKKYQGGFLGALISAGASIAGGIIANKANQQQAAEQNAFQTASTARQMAFQERMSNTAHQREIKDLRKAGLNPILSAKTGGASTPGGASSAGTKADIKDVLGGASSAFIQYRQANAQVDNTRAQTELIGAQTTKTYQEEENLKATVGLTQQQKLKTQREAINLLETKVGITANIAKTLVETKNAELRGKILRNELKISKQQYREMLTRFPGLKQEQKIDTELWGKVARYLQRFNPMIPKGSYQIKPRSLP